MRRRVAIVLLAALAGCSVSERSDYLVGRRCDAKDPESCDPGQACLPHAWADVPTDFRCRDKASFSPTSLVPNPPLAYCEEGSIECPEGLVCEPDRVRPRDGAVRRTVCQEPGSPFLPPEPDAG
ncbi:MAG: hypothetical protein HYV07_09210 [Deltaproteobacteria bacterium]|nr:hypothetical protein [Deltaproteobacteria bacterium]